MKLYCIVLLLCFTHTAQSMNDNGDEKNKSLVIVKNKQTNATNITILLEAAATLKNFQFSLLSDEQQRNLNIMPPKITAHENLLYFITDGLDYVFQLNFKVKQPVDCSHATIKHTTGSPFIRIVVPRKEQ